MVPDANIALGVQAAPCVYRVAFATATWVLDLSDVNRAGRRAGELERLLPIVG